MLRKGLCNREEALVIEMELGMIRIVGQCLVSS